MKHLKILIEAAVPMEAIDQASALEKSIRHGDPSTLQLWWLPHPFQREAYFGITRVNYYFAEFVVHAVGAELPGREP